MPIYCLRTTLDDPISHPCPRPAVEAPSSMISSSTLSLQPGQGPPHRWEDLGQFLRGINRIIKIFGHAYDTPNNSWPSKKGRGKLVAKAGADPFLVAKTLTIATRATHYCLDDLCIDQDSLRLSQSTHRQTKPWFPLTPIWEFNPFQCLFPKGPLLRTIHSFLNPSSSSSLFYSFSQRACHWFYGLQVTENKYSTDALVHARSDKYPKTSSHRGVTSDDAMCIEVSTPYFQEEKTRSVVLDLSSPSQSLNSSGQPGPCCSRCSSFVRQNQVYSCIHGSCIISEDSNDIFQAVGLSGNKKTIRNCLHRFKGYVRLEHKPWAFVTKEKGFITTNRKLGSSHGEPEDNAGSIKRVEDNNSRTPADGESAKKPPKRRQSGHQSSHYDEGTNGTAKAYKKRKQDSAEREDVDSDELAEGSGKAKNGRKRKDEEEEPGKKKFACPFYKYDRQAFMSSRTCVGPGWDSVHRVKEHIFRRHMLLSTQCEDCLTVFETLPALDEHLKNPCRKKLPQRSYGINKEQEKQLRSRRMYQKSLDEEEKWRAIYKIIFPGEKNIPSPYYEPEVPEFPDIYQQMLIKDLPEIVTRRLTAPESGLVEYITANVMANRHNLTREADKKPIGGLDLMGSTQASVGKRVKQHIQDTVEAAVKEMLSRVDGQKEPSPELKINVESPDEDLSTWMKTEEYMQPGRPTRPQSNLLQPPVISGTDTKPDPRAQYPTPTSSAFDRSPEAPLAAMTEPSFLQPVFQGENFHPLFNENHPDNELEGMTGGGSFPDLENLISSNWENLSSTGSIPAVPMYTSAGPSLSLNVSGPTSTSLQNHEFLSAQNTEPESFALGPWDFSPAPAIQSVDSGYETIPCPSTSNAFEEWGGLNDHFNEPYTYDER